MVRSFALVPFIGFLALAGCAVQLKLDTPPYPPVPEIRSEIIPAPPVKSDGLIWQPGHWEWTGANYDWQAGSWVPRGSHSDQWQDGFWSKPDGKWLWVAGHWV